VKCDVHRDTDAIGTCAVCKKNVCAICGKWINGKLYCNDEAAKIGTQRQEKKGKYSSVRELLIDVAIAAVMAMITYALALWLGWL
jgi:hypothetical protein